MFISPFFFNSSISFITVGTKIIYLFLEWKRFMCFMSNTALYILHTNWICSIMVNMFNRSVVYRGFMTPIRSNQGQSNWYLLLLHKAHRINKYEQRLAQNQDNVPEWRDMSTCRLLFPWASSKKNPSKHVGLLQREHHHCHWNVTCSRHKTSEILLTWR